MARKDQLRRQRAGTVINVTSKQQESEIIRALEQVVDYLADKFGRSIYLEHASQRYLKDIVAHLRRVYPNVEFHCHFDNSFIRPDGGILYIRAKGGDRLLYLILVPEANNQGTNEVRVAEGLPRQARGNAIERLGKNVIGLRAALMQEAIFSFVCYGYGCDFKEDSSILDRVTTMAMFGKLNKIYLHNEEHGRFNRGSFFFRPQRLGGGRNGKDHEGNCRAVCILLLFEKWQRFFSAVRLRRCRSVGPGTGCTGVLRC